MSIKKKSDLKYINFNLDEIFPKKCAFFDLNYKGWRNEQICKWINNKVKNYTKNGKEAKDFKITNYVRPIMNFFQFCSENGIVTNEIIDEMLNKSQEDRDDYFENYVQYLKRDAKKKQSNPYGVCIETNQGLKDSSIGGLIIGNIESFFSFYNKGLKTIIGRKCKDKNLNEMTLEPDIMKRIFQAIPNLQYKLIFLFLQISGWRINDILLHLSESDKNNNAKYQFKLYKSKTELEGYYYIENFITQKWLVQVNFLFLTHELEDMLKIVYNIDDLTKLDCRKLFLNKFQHRISMTDFQKSIKDICQKLGINGNFKDGCIRKLVKNLTKRAGLGDFGEHLIAHTQDELTNVYFTDLKKIDFFFKEWKKLEPSIVLESKVVNISNDQIEKQQIEIESLKLQLKQMQEFIQTIMKNNIIVSDKQNPTTPIVLRTENR